MQWGFDGISCTARVGIMLRNDFVPQRPQRLSGSDAALRTALRAAASILCTQRRRLAVLEVLEGGRQLRMPREGRLPRTGSRTGQS
eukprot:gene4195-16504_t